MIEIQRVDIFMVLSILKKTSKKYFYPTTSTFTLASKSSESF